MAAGQPSGTARRPTASEEPMPVGQSGLCTMITPGRVSGAAPVTTTIGSAPPARSSPMPRSTSRVPPSSTRAFG